PTALVLPAATNGDLGTSRLKGRLAGTLHQSGVSAEGRSAGFFGSTHDRRRFWRGPVLARLGSSDEAACSTAAKVAKETTEVTTEGATKDSMPDPRSDLTVSLWRGAQQGRYESYKVPWRENQTVLDVVTFVQRHLDPTLSYRFACRVGMCGSCAMTVNGRP